MNELVFPFDPAERAVFTKTHSPLIAEWAAKYDCLFDADDIRVARNQAPADKGGYHFYEWRAAILLFEATGMLSLVESYQGLKQQRKQRVLEKLLSDEQRRLILNVDRAYKAQAPDLLVYKRDYSAFFFCEVKGPGDRLRPHAAAFYQAIGEACGGPVTIARFVRLEKLARLHAT